VKRLPIAKTTIKEIINDNFLYVDKSRYIKELLDDGNKYWFLARPRRFGKSLFLDTLRAAFTGEKELFRGLYLENNWDWSKKFPVISISFGSSNASNVKELNIHLKYLLKTNANRYEFSVEEELIPDCFSELIVKLNKKYNSGVVILIDEYDKPILDNITSKNIDSIRRELAGFYSVLKDADAYLKFVFLTGVSKFSKTSIVSKLNNLTDISLSEKYADICGYTQVELENVFAEYLYDENLDKIKEWYDGYNFLGSNVYNPFDILFYLSEKKFKSYWFETGTPTFLLNLIKEQKYFIPQLNKITLSESQLGEFDINHIAIETLLFQTGYLTINEEIEIGSIIKYKLSIPNLEVQIGLNDYLLRSFFSPGSMLVEQSNLSDSIYLSLYNNKLEELEKAFYSFFASVPHDWYRKNNISNYEGYYCSVFYTYFNALGLHIIAEDVSSRGNVDFTVIMDDAVYIFEIKLKSNSKNALKQIKERKYHEKYLSDKKDIYLVGIEFDIKKKNISKFQYESITGLKV